MDRIKELRQKYYESIKLLQNEQDILEALPKPDSTNFFSLIAGVIDFLEKDLITVQQELQDVSPTDDELKEYIEDELKILLFKKSVCTSLLEKGNQDKTIEDEAEQTPKKNIIFATTESGNVCIENDLKTIPEEYYDSLEALLTELQEGVNERNTAKAKKMVSTNKKMNEIHEVKDFKIRLFYKNLSADTVYVLMVRMKKSNNDALDRKEIIERASQRNKQYESLKKEIKDPLKKEEMIQSNAKILESTIGHIKRNKR